MLLLAPPAAKLLPTITFCLWGIHLSGNLVAKCVRQTPQMRETAKMPAAESLMIPIDSFVPPAGGNLDRVL
jgi:hypothetical protein